MNIDSSIEHTWVEVKGKNKNSNILLGVILQKKSAWIDKFEMVLATFEVGWNYD